MMKQSLGAALMIAMTVSLFAVVGLYAGTTVPDVIEMNSPYEHTKSLAQVQPQESTPPNTRPPAATATTTTRASP
jgi:hypothetical protein